MFAPPIDHRGLLFALSLTALLFAASACGGDDSTPPALAATNEVSALSADGSDAEIRTPPVSQFGLLVQDIAARGAVADTNRTWRLSAEIYAKTGAFSDAAAGLAKLKDWGYREGYETALNPLSGGEALLDGGYILHEEIHMFETVAGADAAFQYFAGRVRGNGISEVMAVSGIGDEAFASRTGGGTMVLGTQGYERVFHQVIFRRANVVAVMLTIGIDPLITMDTVVGLGRLVDEKILDRRPHPSPTPLPARTEAADTTDTR